MKKENLLKKIVNAKKTIEKKIGIKINSPRKIKKYFRTKIKIPEETIINGHKMFLSKNSEVSFHLVLKGKWEETETELIKNEIYDGNVVLDIGANIGYFTLIFAKKVGSKGKVFAFEPEPNNFRLLKKNVQVNNFQNVVIENFALSENNGRINLYLSERDVGSHRVYQSNKVTNNFVTVKKIKLDDYLKKYSFSKNISFIKLDVEGAELDVLKGMTGILKNNKPLKILLEYSPSNLKEFGNNPEELLKFLNQYKFSFNIIDSDKKEIRPITVDDLIRKNVKTEINLFCVKNEN